MIHAVCYRLRKDASTFISSDQSGSVSFETVLILPLLLWFYVGSFVFFDAYKVYNRNVKAAYTIGDLLSRQTDSIDNAFLEGLSDVFDYMTSQNHTSWQRIAQLRWHARRNRYRVEWSYGTNGKNAERISILNLDEIVNYLPTGLGGDRFLVVDAYTEYQPAFSVGLSSTVTMRNFTATSPRFAPHLPKN